MPKYAMDVRVHVFLNERKVVIFLFKNNPYSNNYIIIIN